jgi:hypothetical protein
MQVAGRLAEQARIGLLEHIAVLQEKTEQRGEVIDLYIAIHIGRGKAHRATLHGLGDHPEIF